MKKRICVAFPGRFNLIEELDGNEDPKLLANITNFDSRRFNDFLKRDSVSKIVVDFDGDSIPIALRGFHIYDPPKTSNSKSSNAIYYARSENKKDGLLLQYLSPNSSTSGHYHKIQTEAYFLLAGEAVIKTACAEIFLKEPGISQAVILPNENSCHPLITSGKPAITLMQIKNCPGGLSMKDHYYPNQ